MPQAKFSPPGNQGEQVFFLTKTKVVGHKKVTGIRPFVRPSYACLFARPLIRKLIQSLDLNLKKRNMFVSLNSFESFDQNFIYHQNLDVCILDASFHTLVMASASTLPSHNWQKCMDGIPIPQSLVQMVPTLQQEVTMGLPHTLKSYQAILCIICLLYGNELPF